MKLLHDLEAVVYRAVAIKYQRVAFSAKGARKFAGRFNRPDIAALYVALEADTAVSEYYQGDQPRPCALMPANLNVKNLVDLRGDLSKWEPDWRAWASDWLTARDDYVAGDKTADCPSWRCADDAISRNMSGIIYPSRWRPGGSNLALFVEDATLGLLYLKPIDPLHEIPSAYPPRLT